MPKVVIVGAGPAGIAASWVFKSRKGVEVTLLEPGEVGGEYNAGGLRYLHETELILDLLEVYEIPYSSYRVQGGILLHGEVKPYPECFRGMDKDHIEQIRIDHFTKTRHQQPTGTFGAHAMNNPKGGAQRAVRCDTIELFNKLLEDVEVKREAMVRVEPGRVITNGGPVPYDYLVLTVPLWLLRDRVSWRVPDASAMVLNVATIFTRADLYMRWDYVYTPYTPETCIHRLSHFEDGYTVESSGKLDERRLHGDLNFLFPHGWHQRRVISGLKGHLLPISHEPEWPDNVAPLGRYAQWDPRATFDVVLDNAIELDKRWFG